MNVDDPFSAEYCSLTYIGAPFPTDYCTSANIDTPFPAEYCTSANLDTPFAAECCSPTNIDALYAAECCSPTNVGGHAMIGNEELCFRIRVRHCSESRLHFRIHRLLCHRAFCRPSRCFMLQEQALCRPSEYSLQSRKHSDGRHDALCCRGKYCVARQSTRSRRSKHSVGRHDALSCRGMTNPGQEWSFSDRSKHSDAHQSALSNRGNTLTRVTMLYAAEANTLTGVRVLYPNAETLCRPSEYFRRSRKHPVGRQSAVCDKCKLDVIIK